MGPFSNYFEERVHFQTEFEKIPQARAWEARARAPDPGPNGVCFQTQFENGHLFVKYFEHGHIVSFFLKMGPGPVFKNVTGSFFQSFTLE